MAELDRLLAANAGFAASADKVHDTRPRLGLAVVTCMDTRIDPLAVLGLDLGDAHVLRNAGARVTDDVLRSLALSVHVLGVRTVAVIEHTDCGLAATTDEELRERTGAPLEFLALDDHAAALGHDVERLAGAPFLAPVGEFAGWLLDTSTGTLEQVVRLSR